MKTNKVVSITKRKQGISEKLIENFMILANETVASHIYYMQLPFIYRIHNNPDEIKIDNTLEIIEKLGYKLVHLQNAYTGGQKAIQNIKKRQKFFCRFAFVLGVLRLTKGIRCIIMLGC